MSNTRLSAEPNEPYQWRESVLSTRSLSYLSNIDGSPGPAPLGGTSHGRSVSLNMHRPPTRRSTEMTDSSDYGTLEMEPATRDAELRDIPELPESVAESPLFTLPREIRDRVYAFCMTTLGVQAVEWPVSKKAYHLQPQLLRTCKIIYKEAASLLYTLNIMTFHHPSDANMFVRAVTLPSLSRHTSNVSLHIKAQDTRLWMPYLTSKDMSRSLKADFPNLRELSIRFRSNKWQHSVSPDTNMKQWSEDSRLDEILDGLRHVFLPDGPQDSKSERELEAYISNHPADFPLDPSDPGYRTQWLDIHKARSDFVRKQEATPTIRVVCACRVHASHFNALTAQGPPVVPPIAQHLVLPDLSQANNGTGVIQQSPIPPFESPAAVNEGEPFRGFTAIDLHAGLKRLHDPDLGSANVARTPFADKKGILISLEIHCLDPKRMDSAAEHRMV